MKEKQRKAKKNFEKEGSLPGNSQSKGNIDRALCSDFDCHRHGNLKTRGRMFEGKVIKKFDKRVVIEFERTIYIKKYERYKKSRTKIHARMPNCIKDEINLGDYIKVQECRPLSKIINFAVIEKIRSAEFKK